MKKLARIPVLLAVLLGVSVAGFSQSGAQEKRPAATASVSGRVMVGDQPLPNTMVMLYPAEYGSLAAPLRRAHTDGQGYFHLTNLPPGNYGINAVYPGFLVAGNVAHTFSLGRTLVLEAGEAITNFDLPMRRGGVISGRITDANNQPLVMMPINLIGVGGTQAPLNVSAFMPYYSQMMRTDDRGVYRIYGLPAGRYKVSVGRDGGTTDLTARRGYYQRTFYPGVTEEAKADVLEVTEGGEVENVDIAFGLPLTTYAASGRIVDAATGKPIAGVLCRYNRIQTMGDKQTLASGGVSKSPSNENGEFRLEGILPGRYAASVVQVMSVTQSISNVFGIPVVFEVKEEDVGGLVLKVTGGGSVSGIVIIESAIEDATATAANARPQLAPFTISANTVRRSGVAADSAELALLPAPTLPAPVAADGSFTITSISPGRVGFRVSSYKVPRGLSIARLEYQGEILSDGIEIKPGDHLTGVRVVVTYGAGSIRGVVKTEEGALPATVEVMVNIVSRNQQFPLGRSARADAQGRFQIEHLPPGEYEVSAYARALPGNPPLRVAQTIRVTNGETTPVTLVLEHKTTNKDR